MAPSPIPAPLPPWAKVLLQLAPLISAGLQAVLEHIGEMQPSSAATPSEWRHLQIVGQPVGSLDASERFITTMDIVNITGGAIDNSWTETDYANVSSHVFSLMSAWAANMSSNYQWREIRYYRRSFNPLSNPLPFTRSGAPDFVQPAVVTGAGATSSAPQVSLTSTDRTPYPRHWGRNYWPHPSGDTVTLPAYAKPTMVNSLSAGVTACYTDLAALEFFPMVVVTQVDKVPVRGLLGITQVQIDDVFDVIRRRRQNQATLRVVTPVP